MATAAVKAKRAKQVERANSIFKGAAEPLVTQENYNSDLLKALNYYNQEEEKTLRKNLLAYYKKKDPKVYAVVDKASDSEIRHIAVVARLIEREQYVGDKERNYLETKLAELTAKYNVTPKKVATNTKAVTNVVSIEDRIIAAAHKHAAEIDNEIDEFVKTKSSVFSTKNYLLTNSISGAVSKRIGEFYKPLQRELTETIGGNCDQLNEGYSHFSKSQLKKFLAFVESIILDCQQMVADSKVRKPRTTKAKPAGVLVSKMKYQIKNDEFGLKSCNPADIVGSTEVWVFNTKYRRLTVYRANRGETLSVRGTTILNFDLASSETKTLRKPIEFFASAGVTKRPLTAAFNAIKTKGTTPNGRVNEETIILKAF